MNTLRGNHVSDEQKYHEFFTYLFHSLTANNEMIKSVIKKSIKINLNGR